MDRVLSTPYTLQKGQAAVIIDAARRIYVVVDDKSAMEAGTAKPEVNELIAIAVAVKLHKDPVWLQQAVNDFALDLAQLRKEDAENGTREESPEEDEIH